jgi:D-threo-aldose 1-dehydrogenase
MRHDELVTIPGTTVRITRLGFGTVPIGGLYDEMPYEAAQLTLAAAYRLGIRYFDTVPVYGFGLAERRLGAYLRSPSAKAATGPAAHTAMISPSAPAPSSENV